MWQYKIYDFTYLRYFVLFQLVFHSEKYTENTDIAVNQIQKLSLPLQPKSGKIFEIN